MRITMLQNMEVQPFLFYILFAAIFAFELSVFDSFGWRAFNVGAVFVTDVVMPLKALRTSKRFIAKVAHNYLIVLSCNVCISFFGSFEIAYAELTLMAEATVWT